MDSRPQLLGSKLGPRIAQLVVQAVIYAHGKLVHVKHKLAMAVFHSISDEISDEVDVTLGPFLKMLHDNLDPQHPAYPAVNFLHTASGQLKALVGTGLQASGLLSSIALIMNNELADTVASILHTNPHLIPDVGTIAQIVASGQMTFQEGVDAMGGQGIPPGWAGQIIAQAYNYPGLTECLEMWRRGIISEGQMSVWLTLGGIPVNAIPYLEQLAYDTLSPADLALAVLRGNMSQEAGNAAALQAGTTTDNFQVLINNTGEPPGTDQLLEAYRRGIIDQATLERGILQSRYRNEWIPTIEALRYEPMSTSDAVDAVVQNNLTAAQAAAIADQNGLTPGAIGTLISTAGEPLSRTEMSQLYNRGLASEAQFTQALAESRLKDKYGALAFQLRTRLIEGTELSRAVVFGTIKQADAVAKTLELGYAPEDAALIVNASVNEKIQSYRDRVVEATEALYAAGGMSEGDAQSAITSLGYEDSEATLILKAADYKREARVIGSAISAVRAKYLAHHITSGVASGYLDAIGLASSQRDYLLKLWGVEYNAFTKVLTEAQIVKAVNDSLITSQDGESRLMALGYSQGDADLLLQGA